MSGPAFRMCRRRNRDLAPLIPLGRVVRNVAGSIQTEYLAILKNLNYDKNWHFDNSLNNVEEGRLCAPVTYFLDYSKVTLCRQGLRSEDQSAGG